MNKLNPGEWLSPGQLLESENKAFKLLYQEDGNLVIYRWDALVIWAVMRFSDIPDAAYMSPKGDFILYDHNAFPYWATQTRIPNSYIIMQDDGNLVIYSHDDSYIWDSGTAQTDIPLPSTHPDPVQGRIRTNNLSFHDDSGNRTFALFHSGDIVARKMVGDDVRSDLDILARTGYHILRPFGELGGDRPPWNQGGNPSYKGLDFEDSRFEFTWMSFLDECYERGLRTVVGSAGFKFIGSDKERLMVQSFNRIMHHKPEAVAWFEPINEPASTHGTSDDNGDNTPSYLHQMVRIALEGLPDILWHLGCTSNIDWDGPGRFAQKKYTLPEMKIGCQHPYRAGHFWDKMRHWFSWLYEEPGKYKRLWVYQEVVGRPSQAERNIPLQYVSVMENGHELNNEALALLGAIPCIRGICGSMSGTGVQKFEPYENVVGFTEIPWLISKLPRNVQTYETIHHSGDAWSSIRTFIPNGLVRFDGVTNSSGQIAQFAYGPPTNDSFQLARDFRGWMHNSNDKTSQRVELNAGQFIQLNFDKGRLFVSD